MLPVETPFKIYTGLDGKPLDNGYVYFGLPNQNPITAPVTVYWDAAGTQPAAQPLRTVNGYIMRAGTPANVFFTGQYSELVRDRKGRQVFYARTSDDFSIVGVLTNFIAELASPTGASDIGMRLTPTAAVTTKLDKFLNRMVVPLTAFMSEAEIADANADTMLYDHQPAIQAWVRYVVDNQLSGYFNVRSAHIKSPILMSKVPFFAPGSGVSYRIFGDGPTGSAISEFVTIGAVVRTHPVARIFDFSGQAGPAVLFEGISINGPRGIGIPGGDGLYFDTSNGIIIRDVWVRGMTNGSRKLNTCSYIVHDYCTFEYNGTGIQWDDGVECFISHTTYYRNTCDAYFTGSWKGGIYDGGTHFECIQYGLRLVNCSLGIFNNLTFRQDFAAYTPKLVSVEGASQNNRINNVISDGFGSRLVYMPPASTATGNHFVGLHANGTNFGAAVEIGAGNTGNSFADFTFNNTVIGVVDGAGANNYTLGTISNMSGTGVVLSNADECVFADVKFSGNTADWSNSGASYTLWLNNVVSNMTGLTITRIGQHGAGNYGRTFYGTAIPSSLPYLLGDRTINRAPAVGLPKSWLCTVPGNPGTHVSEGSL